MDREADERFKCIYQLHSCVALSKGASGPTDKSSSPKLFAFANSVVCFVRRSPETVQNWNSGTASSQPTQRREMEPENTCGMSQLLTSRCL